MSGFHPISPVLKCSPDRGQRISEIGWLADVARLDFLWPIPWMYLLLLLVALTLGNVDPDLSELPNARAVAAAYDETGYPERCAPGPDCDWATMATLPSDIKALACLQADDAAVRCSFSISGRRCRATFLPRFEAGKLVWIPHRNAKGEPELGCDA